MVSCLTLATVCIYPDDFEGVGVALSGEEVFLNKMDWWCLDGSLSVHRGSGCQEDLSVHGGSGCQEDLSSQGGSGCQEDLSSQVGLGCQKDSST